MQNTFIQQIIKHQIVFYLKKGNQQAVCSSNVFFIEENNQPISVFPFWSDELKAASCRKEEWENYEIAEIPLADFMEFWCLGMYEDGVAAGIDFDENLCGEEQIPTELLLKIIDEAEKSATKLTFKNFVSLKQLKNYLETNE